MWIGAFGLAVSARMASIWAVAPSTRTIQGRRCPGPRASAWSNTAAMTSAASAATEAVSHLPTAFGPGRFLRSFFLAFFLHPQAAPHKP
jgi:hypothetical protein